MLIESTLSGRYLIRFIKLLKAKNYEITIIFLFADSPDILIERIKIRVKKGGHFVLDEDVRRRFKRGKSNFWNIYKNLVDTWVLVYNFGNSFEEIVICKKDDALILDEVVFEKFVEGIK